MPKQQVEIGETEISISVAQHGKTPGGERMTVEENMTSATRKSAAEAARALRDLRSVLRGYETLGCRLKEVERRFERLVATDRSRRRACLDSLVDALNRKRDSMGRTLAIQMLCRRQMTAAEIYLLMPRWWTKDQVTANGMRNVVCDANTLLRESGVEGGIKAVIRGRLKWRSVEALAQYAEKANQELSRATVLIRRSPVKAKEKLLDLTKRHPHYLEALLALAQCLTVVDQRDSELPQLRRAQSLLSDHERKLSLGLDSLAKRLTDDSKNPLWEGASEAIRAGRARLEEARGALKTLYGLIGRIEEADPETKKLRAFLEKVEALQAIQGGSSQNQHEEYEKALADVTQSAFFSESVRPMLEEIFSECMDDLHRRSIVAEVLLQTTDLLGCSTVPKFTESFDVAVRKRLSEEMVRIRVGMEREDFRLAKELERAQQHMKKIGVEPSRDKVLVDLGWDECKLEKAEKARMWLRQRVQLEEERDTPEV